MAQFVTGDASDEFSECAVDEESKEHERQSRWPIGGVEIDKGEIRQCGRRGIEEDGWDDVRETFGVTFAYELSHHLAVNFASIPTDFDFFGNGVGADC